LERCSVDSDTIPRGKPMADIHTVGPAVQAEELEQLATTAYLKGRDEESEAFRVRAHRAFLERGDRERAAWSAFWLAFGMLQRGAGAPASGWLTRAERILDEAQLDSVVRGYLLTPVAVRRVVTGDAAGADLAFTEAAEIAKRFGDRDLASLACHGRGRALIRLGHITRGVALLDEAMVAVIADEVTPIVAGDIYCSVLEACQEIFDLRRAYEWTTSFARWCAAQSDLVRYRGECLLYRAEVMQLRGHWTEAMRDARDASDLLTSTQHPMRGTAFYRVGEIHRLRGEFTKAEAAYTHANEHGRNPQPGLSLLRHAQGRVEDAAGAIRAVLRETRARARRAPALIAAVEIFLAAGEHETATSAAAELCDIARTIDAPLLRAASAHADGALLLARADLAAASALLRQACDTWRELGMRYEEAHTLLLIADTCTRCGDADGSHLHMDAARRLFRQLDAGSGLARVANQATTSPAGGRIGALSKRELEVLRLLAAGKTNRQAAEALFISERTVARHVSNIFDKLGVSTRAAATAWAYQNSLV
jgi:DNA-binding CsgD family transcriptional regulator